MNKICGKCGANMITGIWENAQGKAWIMSVCERCEEGQRERIAVPSGLDYNQHIKYLDQVSDQSNGVFIVAQLSVNEAVN